MQSARSKFSTLQQICTYIPGHRRRGSLARALAAKLARKHGVDEQARSFANNSKTQVIVK